MFSSQYKIILLPKIHLQQDPYAIVQKALRESMKNQ